jgi:uncharacterized Zn-finger protein
MVKPTITDIFSLSGNFPKGHSWTVAPIFFGLIDEVSIYCERVDPKFDERKTIYLCSLWNNPHLEVKCPFCGHRCVK